MRCPQCGSTRLYKDGLRYCSDDSSIQRYLCRSCGFRFSDPESRRNRKFFYNDHSETKICNVCETESGAHQKRILVEEQWQTEKWASGATTLSKEAAEVKGKILEFLWHLQKQGRSPITIKGYKEKLLYIARQANLLDPEAAKEFLAKADMNETSKRNYTSVLISFYGYLGISWIPPNYKVACKIPYIPTEKELDLLIANMGKTLQALLQLLKETGMRVREALKLK